MSKIDIKSNNESDIIVSETSPRSKKTTLKFDEAKFSRIFRHHGVMMMLIEPHDGHIIDVNEAAAKFYGYDRKTFCQLKIKDIYKLSDAEIRNFLNQDFQAPKPDFVFPHKLADGNIRQIEVHASLIKIEGESFLFSILHDVTERVIAQKQLQFRHELETILASISTYFIKPDHHEIEAAIAHALKTIGEFYRVEYSFIIKFSEDLNQFSLEYQWHSSTRERVTIMPEASAEQFPIMAGTLLKGNPFAFSNVGDLLAGANDEYKYFKKCAVKSMIIVPMISAGIVVGGIGFATINKKAIWDADTITLLRMVGEIITNTLKRKQTEDALRKSELKYRRFFEEDLTADYIADSTGRILFCNPAFIKIFGFESQNQALQCNLADLDTPSGSFAKQMQNLSQDKLIEGYEFELVRRDGEPVFLIGNIRGIFDKAGNLVESKGYLFDITEHKKTEEQFRGAQKMEAIGRLAGGIAHDFNNLLTVINGYSDLLVANTSLDEGARKKIELIKKAGEKATALTGQLLAFSRRQIIKPKVINLNRVITEFEKMLHRLIGENIEIVNQLNPSIGNVMIDPAQLEQILINLAVNARDAMPLGGKLTVSTKNVVVDKNFARKHTPIQPGNYVLMAVSDSGVGMASETMSHIFEPFFTTKEKGKGTGLGLSTIYGIVKQAKGYIWVESQLDAGTTFLIYLPHLDEEVLKDNGFIAEDKAIQGKENILVVEDDRSVREITTSFLENYGYTVLAAENAESALKFCRDSQQKIDLAIIDVIMPDMGGKDLADRIVHYLPQIKIVYISGYTDDDIVQHGVLMNGVEFLQKPFDAQALGKKVRQVLDSTDGLN